MQGQNTRGRKNPAQNIFIISSSYKKYTQTENGITTIHGYNLLVPGSKRGSLRYQDNSAMRFTKFDCYCFEATRKQPKTGKSTKRHG